MTVRPVDFDEAMALVLTEALTEEQARALLESVRRQPHD
jgi:hypothetical protein